MKPNDAYDGIRYRSLIAWSARLEREWPFLVSQLHSVPERSVVDLGCGPGEHLGRLQNEGWRTLGIDRSAKQIEDAHAHHPNVTFIQGRMEDLAELSSDKFGAVLCLGNALPSLDDSQMDRLVAAIATQLRPGGVFLTQLLDYTPILAGTKRALPVTVRPSDDGGESVFVRIYAPDPEPGWVQFLPTTLRLRADGGSPLEVSSAHRIRHRGWVAEELEARLSANGLGDVRRFGALDGSAYEPGRSSDLVLVARKCGQKEPGSATPPSTRYR